MTRLLISGYRSRQLRFLKKTEAIPICISCRFKKFKSYAMEILEKSKVKAKNGLINRPAVVNPKAGVQMHQFMRELFPICRSITGNGVRQTLEIIKKIIPI